jgi:hypothetical protein
MFFSFLVRLFFRRHLKGTVHELPEPVELEHCVETGRGHLGSPFITMSSLTKQYSRYQESQTIIASVIGTAPTSVFSGSHSPCLQIALFSIFAV